MARTGRGNGRDRGRLMYSVSNAQLNITHYICSSKLGWIVVVPAEIGARVRHRPVAELS